MLPANTVLVGAAITLAMRTNNNSLSDLCGCLMIAYKNETEVSAWEYWEMMKTKLWIELSEEENEKIIIANLVIAADVGQWK